MKKATNESGFSYVDVMIGVTILLVGVLALVSAITRGIAMTTVSQEMLTAKQIASSTVEAIFTARDVEGFIDESVGNVLGWEAIGNVGSTSTPNGVFLAGEQPIYPTAGADGIVGTADDAKGPDGVAGNGDDGAPEPGYTRTILITDITDPARPNAPISLRQIDVTINYWVGAKKQVETFTTFIANYRTEEEIN